MPEAVANTEALAITDNVSDAPAALTVVPVPGRLSSEFGLRSDPVRRKRRRRQRKRQRMHKGLDFIAQRGTLVHAAGPGVVVKAQVTGGYGRLVVIDHGGGLRTRYAHLQRFKVRKGQSIEAGKVVGDVGSSGRVTGPHLHFEVRQDGVALQPADVVQFDVPKCSRRSRRCKSIDRKSRKDRPNS
jgi:murein DD-endopeptidase MepM/ murein hydrolase activator NlpD